MDRHSEHGNVLFLILIAVALFAALSYAVTSSNRAGGGSTEREAAQLAATEIANYAVAVQTAVIRIIASGCLDTEISFERAPFDGSDAGYVNPNSPSNFSCHVFHPNGGGVGWQNPSVEWLDDTHSALTDYGEWFFTNWVCIDQVGTGIEPCHTDIGSEVNEIIMVLRYLDFEVCQQINEEITGSAVVPQEVNAIIRNNTIPKYTGDFSGGLGQRIAVSTGRFSNCVEGNLPGAYEPPGSYHFHHVLLPR